MKKLLLALALWLTPLAALAQCNGVFPPNTLCGNLSASPAPPSAFTASGTVTGPATSVVGHFATWNNTTGTLLADFNLYAAANVWTASNNFTSTFQINGNTVTWPATTGTVPFVGTNNTWTGTNNFTSTFQLGGTTFSLPVSVANGGTGNAIATANSVPVSNGTSAQGATNVGTTGQCLNGVTSGVPQFTSGCRVLLATVTASSSTSLADTTHITSAYADYDVVFENILPATNNVSCELQMYIGGTLQTSSYVANYLLGTGSTAAAAAQTSYVPCSEASSAQNSGNGINGSFTIYGANGSSNKTVGGTVFHFQGTNMAVLLSAGYYSGGTGAVTGVQVTMSSGNIASGSIKIYGHN